jgi:hypothetical protein
MAAAPPRKPAAKQPAQRQKLVKVLRIGILQDGKIVQEKRIGEGNTVTVGASPKATFSYALPKVPRKFPLFVAKGDKYFLRFLPSMAGKIATKDGVQALDALGKSGAAKRKGDVYVLPLTEKNRGKISIDNVTVLFQFVPAPPEPLTPTYKTDFRPKLFTEDDPVFLGFLGLFTLLAAVFVVYVQSVETPALLPTDVLPERFVKLAIPPPDPADPSETEDPDLDEEGDGPAVAKEKEEEAGGGAEEQPKEQAEVAPKTAEERAAEEIRRKQQMEAEVKERSLLLKMIGTRGESSSGQMVDDLFGEGAGVGTDLDAALAEAGGVEQGTYEALGEKRGTGSGTGRDDASIGDLARAQGGSSDVGAGPATKVTGRISSGTVDVSGGDPAKIKSVINNYTGQVKACYEQRLKSNPALAGRVELLWYINGGRVSSVEVLGNSTGDSELANCIALKVRTWRFPADLEADTEVVYPFILSPG